MVLRWWAMSNEAPPSFESLSDAIDAQPRARYCCAWLASELGGAVQTQFPAYRRASGQRFPPSVRRQALEENPSTCVYCRMETNAPQVDHAVPLSRGGNATLDNAQTTCAWCNASKGARDFPVNPPSGYRGAWPPWWW